MARKKKSKKQEAESNLSSKLASMSKKAEQADDEEVEEETEEPVAPKDVTRKEEEKPVVEPDEEEDETEDEDTDTQEEESEKESQVESEEEEDDGEEEEEQEEVKVKDLEFVDLIKRINEALKSNEGQKLNCRLKVVVEDKEAYIYQGLRNNIYARIFQDKKHLIYRYTLKRLLTSHPATKDYFTADKIRT